MGEDIGNQERLSQSFSPSSSLPTRYLPAYFSFSRTSIEENRVRPPLHGVHGIPASHGVIRDISLGFFKIRLYSPRTATDATTLTSVTTENNGSPEQINNPSRLHRIENAYSRRQHAASTSTPRVVINTQHELQPIMPFTIRITSSTANIWQEVTSALNENDEHANSSICIHLNQLEANTSFQQVDLRHFFSGMTRVDLHGSNFNHTLPLFPDTLEYLNISSSALSRLPALPPALLYLHAEDNYLTQLPLLPSSLTTLFVANNRLQVLADPLPTSLQFIDISHNALRHLPTLPANLQGLHVAHNVLYTLPHLPATLGCLDISFNRLTSLPERVVTMLNDFPHRVHLDGNPLSARIRRNLALTQEPPEETGSIFFEINERSSLNGETMSLKEAIALWYSNTEKAMVIPQWELIEQETGTANFSIFLHRLQNSINYHHPDFKEQVCAWLNQLLIDSELRARTYELATDALSTCEDRVALSLNSMFQLALSIGVERGQYDDQLEQVIELARGMFRLEVLEKIAREKTRSLQATDEIEVYLGYQVQLREKLNLPATVPQMRFFQASDISVRDLQHAERRVRFEEQHSFIYFLSTHWDPWQVILQRLDPQGFQKAREQIIEMTMGKHFQKQVYQRLAAELGPIDDQEILKEAERSIGARLCSEIAHTINLDFTQAFLQARGIIL